MDKAFDPVKILAEEVKKSTLFFIGLDFYKDADAFLRELEQTMNATAPDSTKYALTEDRLKASKIAVETIFAHRLRKIIKQAQIDVFDKNKSVSEALTLEEKELYTRLLTLVGTWKTKHIDSILNRKEQIIPAPPPEYSVDTGTNIKDYVVVRVLQNVPLFTGVDMKPYVLMKEDIVTVPSLNAIGLITKKAAVEVVLSRHPVQTV